MSGKTFLPSTAMEWLELANEALDRNPRTAFATGVVTGLLLKFSPEIRPDHKLLGSISQWSDLHRDEPITGAQVEDLVIRVHDWIGPTRPGRKRVPDPKGGYRLVPRS
jgi:hypothetical protein